MAGARIVAGGWGFRYPGRAARALTGVTFTIEPGQLVVLMGASGSGKSTLLGGLAGTLPEGESEGRLAVEPAVRIGLVQQEPEGNIVMETVGDDVAFPLENAAVPADRIWPRVRAVLRHVGLGVPLERPTGQLSGGQQQLLALAAAAVTAPGLLLLDEPTANLDPTAAARVVDAVAALRAEVGCTVVVVEHRVEPWLAGADRVLLVADGTVVPFTPPQLRAHLARRPDIAVRVWLDHEHLPAAHPVRPPGAVLVEATGVAVAGRLDATDLTCAAGEVVALTGPPGSGKTTLLMCLAGLMRPSAGTVRVVGGPDGPPWQWPAAQVARTLGVVFQNPEHQFVTGRVVDELQHGLERAHVPHEVAQGRAGAMLARLRLDHLAGANPFTLSGGEQRRLGVASSLVLEPAILVLDEPTFGQDPATWAQLVAIIAAHRDAGGAVVMATHDPALVAALGAREVRMGAAPAPAAPAAPAPAAAPVAAPGGRAAARAAGAVLGSGAGLRALAGSTTFTGARTGLRRLDPLVLVGTAALLSGAALLSASVGLTLVLAGLSLVAALVGGLGGRRLGLLLLPVGVAAISVAVSNALLGEQGISDPDSWAGAALPASRVLAVALPGLVAAVALDPTALADALTARLRVPARPAYSALAGLRLLPLLAEEWLTLGRASRARGVAGTGPLGRAGQFLSMTFRLLVSALRRGGRLALAMDARGLRPGQPRTVARPLLGSRWDLLGLALGALALAAASATHGW